MLWKDLSMANLVLGYGKLGKEIVAQTGWDYISRSKDGFDFAVLNSYYYYLDNHDTVINCIAHTNTYSDERQKHLDINFKAVCDLVDYCNITGKKFVHISSDYVYSGSVAHARESDVPVHNRCWYTYSKLLADGYIEARCNNYLIIRTSFKPRPFPYPKAITTQWGNFDYVNTISSLIIELINTDAAGIVNVGTKLKDIYTLAVQTRPDVVPSHEYLNPEMPTDISMDVSKMKDLLCLK